MKGQQNTLKFWPRLRVLLAYFLESTKTGFPKVKIKGALTWKRDFSQCTETCLFSQHQSQKKSPTYKYVPLTCRIFTVNSDYEALNFDETLLHWYVTISRVKVKERKVTYLSTFSGLLHML